MQEWVLWGISLKTTACDTFLETRAHLLAVYAFGGAEYAPMCSWWALSQLGGLKPNLSRFTGLDSQV